MSSCIVIMFDDGRQEERPCTIPPTLQEMQQLVSGYIELVTSAATWHGEPAELYCNEEGKLKDMPVNARATLYMRVLSPGFSDIMVGNVVLLVGAARWSTLDNE